MTCAPELLPHQPNLDPCSPQPCLCSCHVVASQAALGAHSALCPFCLEDLHCVLTLLFLSVTVCSGSDLVGACSHVPGIPSQGFLLQAPVTVCLGASSSCRRSVLSLSRWGGLTCLELSPVGPTLSYSCEGADGLIPQFPNP